MMARKLSRRDFLKWSAFGLASLAFRPMASKTALSSPPLYNYEQFEGEDLARIAIESVSVYSEPSDKSSILYQRYRDELVNVYYDVVSEYGPGYNPLWYRVWRGYIHSGHLQKVNVQLNPVLSSIPESGQLAEVTVPVTQSLRYTSYSGWESLYRLYYQSVHWIIAVEEGPDGEAWYKLEDELDRHYVYYVPASHLRPVTAQELEPISPDVPFEKKRIEVSIAQQTLTAYENDKVVMHTKISSGMPQATPPPGQTSTDTPRGEFNVQSKMPSKHMGDGNLTADLNAYELPGVPWVCFFEPENGVATHGTYWHTNYGTTMSHGCVNMRPEEAKWIYRWTTPVATVDSWETRGYGTRVIVY